MVLIRGKGSQHLKWRLNLVTCIKWQCCNMFWPAPRYRALLQTVKTPPIFAGLNVLIFMILNGFKLINL